MIQPETILLFAIATSMAAFIGGYGGFGFGIVSVTFFSFFPGEIKFFTDGVTINGFIIYITLIFVANKNGKIDWKNALPIVFGTLIGTPLGYQFILIFGNQPIFRICLGGVLILFGIIGIKSFQPKRIVKYWATPIGILSGFLGGAFLTGGPPVVMYIYSRTDEPQKMKATLQFIFCLLSFIRITTVFFHRAELDGASMMLLSAWSLPFNLIILIIAHRLSLKHSSKTFRKVVYFLLTIFGGIILIKSFQAYF